MLDGPEMLDVLSCNHCVWKPKVIECLPLVHCRLSTRVKAFGTTLCVASDAPFSVHGDCPAGNAVVAANAEPGKLSDDCPAGRLPIPTSGPARYGARLSVGAVTGWGKRVNP